MHGLESPLLLHHYLVDSARLHPDAPAIMQDGRATPFGELYETSRSLAAVMMERGLVRGDRIALVMPKSSRSVASLFGSLLAGAVYVPIPPRWPAHRIDSVIMDCAPRFVIVEHPEELGGPISCLKESLPLSGSEPLVIDTSSGQCIPWQEVSRFHASRYSEPAVEPNDPAFILFTSGSTGRPKGVTLSHRAVGAFVRWSADQFEMTATDKIACPSSLSFDLSTFDIFNMALCGATCVVASESLVWTPRFLTRFVEENGITAWYSVPSLAAGMVNEGGFASIEHPDLRLVLLAGESFPTALAVKLRAALPSATICNLYGPTETNVVTWHQLPAEIDASHPIPIGRACPYAAIDIVHDTDEAPDTGELLVTGESLMTGYWNMPEVTREALVETVDEHAATRRFYRTGDRVTMDASGQCTFVGRLDRQVKRHGVRIELGEIEAALSVHAEVLEAGVVFANDTSRVPAIAAFVRLRDTALAAPHHLKAHCATILPSYMLPDRILIVNRLPRGNRGKVDYAALEDCLKRGLN